MLLASCNPGVQDGAAYFSCVADYDVTGDVMADSLTVLTTATSEVNCCGYLGNVLHVRYALSRWSDHITDTVATWEGGTTTPTSGVSYTFAGLDSSLYTYALTVEVYATDFSSSSEYVNGIYAGSTILSSFCDPGVDNGGYFFTCLTNQDVTGDVSGGSLSVLVTGTSDLNCCGYNGYYLYMKVTLSQSSSTISPPTSSPTHIYEVWEDGTNSPMNGISYTFTGLESSPYIHTSLTVEVYATDFSSPSEYVNGIYAGSTTLSSFCDPGVDNGGYFFTCLTNQDVTGGVSGGSLSVLVTGTSDMNCCGYNGYYLYVRVTLSQSGFLPIPSMLPTVFVAHESPREWEGGTVTPTSGVSYTFSGLDNLHYSYILEVEVYATDFSDSSEYVNGIYSGTTTLSSFCDPGVDNGGYFYTCLTSQYVTGDVSGGSLTVLVTGTSQMNCCAYNGYYLYVKLTLSQTSFIPSPSLVPTSGAVSPRLWEGGTVTPTSGVSYTFSGLDNLHYSYILEVEVYATDFSDSSEYVNGIYSGTTTLSSFCDPGVDNGGYFYTCLTSQDVTGDVSGGSLTVLVTGTSQMNCCAYNGYYLYVKLTLSQTSFIPSPSLVPTSGAVSPRLWEGGTVTPTSGVSYTFSGLDNLHYSYILEVEVYATDFSDSSEYVNGIYSGTTTLSSFCDPGVDNGGYFYTCLTSQDVTGDVSGGSLTVLVTGTSQMNCCAYNGYYLYVKLTLSQTSFIPSPSLVPTSGAVSPRLWEGGTVTPTSGVSYTFSGLDNLHYSYILEVEVYATDFSDSSEYVNGIYSGTTTLSSFCDPGVDNGGYFYTCLTSQDVTGDVSGESLTVRVTGTSQMNCCAYNGYYLYVKLTLSQTSFIPSPSLVPTSGAVSPRLWEGGTVTPTSGVSYTFSGLDNLHYSYILEVEVYATDFSDSSEYVNGIYSGTTTLSSFCDPGVDNGGYFYTCLTSQDVTGDVSGGSLTVLVTGTSQMNCCAYNGYYLYVRLTLTESVKTSTILSWEGGSNDPVIGVSFSFMGLDPGAYSYFLSVDVYETDFDSASEYVDGIFSGSNTLTSFCNPNSQEGHQFYSCVSNREVTGDIALSQLVVRTTGSSDVDCCGYNGYELYVRYKLLASSHQSLLQWEGGTNYPADGLSYTFTGFDTTLYQYFLSVEVYETNFWLSSEYVNGIYAGSLAVSLYCDPGIDDGGRFYSCVSDQDVTQYVIANSLEVTSFATSNVDSYPYLGNFFYVRYSLRADMYDSSEVWEGGTNIPTLGIHHTFSSLDTSQYNYFLDVEVYATDFSSTYEYVYDIKAGHYTLASFCDPNLDNGSFHFCFYDWDVTDLVTSNFLDVEAYATSDVNDYNYLGYAFYVRYTLTRRRHSGSAQDDGADGDSATVAIILGTCIPIFLLCCAIVLAVYFRAMRRKKSESNYASAIVPPREPSVLEYELSGPQVQEELEVDVLEGTLIPPPSAPPSSKDGVLPSTNEQIISAAQEYEHVVVAEPITTQQMGPVQMVVASEFVQIPPSEHHLPQYRDDDATHTSHSSYHTHTALSLPPPPSYEESI